jgi:hypothetical protein
MQAMRLSRWKNFISAGACSLGQDSKPSSKTENGKTERPLLTFSQNDGLPSLRAIHTDVLKGMFSYPIELSECEHGRASNSQHPRKRVM